VLHLAPEPALEIAPVVEPREPVGDAELAVPLLRLLKILLLLPEEPYTVGEGQREEERLEGGADGRAVDGQEVDRATALGP
jgi:hypothetical protein